MSRSSSLSYGLASLRTLHCFYEPCNPVHVRSFSALFLFSPPSCPASISFHKILGFPIQHLSSVLLPIKHFRFLFLSALSFTNSLLSVYLLLPFLHIPLRQFSPVFSRLSAEDRHSIYSPVLCQAINLDTATKSCFSVNFLLRVGACLLSPSPGLV